MDSKNLNLGAQLEDIRHLLSHLHGEITALEESYSQVLLVLRKLEGSCDLDNLTGLLRRRVFFKKWEAGKIKTSDLHSSLVSLDKQIDDQLAQQAAP